MSGTMGGGAAVATVTPARTRTAPWAAASVWMIVVFLVAATGWLAAANGVSVYRALTQFLVAQVTASMAFASVGAFVAARRPDQRMGWLLCVVGLLVVLPALAAQYARYGLVSAPGSVPLAPLAAWLTQWLWVPGLVALVVAVPLLFPEGRLISHGARLVGVLAGVGTALTAAARAVAAGPDPSLPEVPNPYGVPGTEGVTAMVTAVGGVLLLASVLGAGGVLVRRLRRSTGDARRQLQLFTYAVVVVLLAELAVPVTALVLIGELPAPLVALAETLTAPWLAVAIGVAILRHRLYDIDRIVNRTLVYGGLTVSVVTIYVLVVGYFGAMFDLRGEPVSLLAAAVVAVLFAPLRERLQILTNRLVYGRREEPYTVLTELGRRLEQIPEHSLDPAAVLATLVSTLREALKLRHAEIQLAGSRGRASTGRPTGTPHRLPLTFGGKPVGELLVSPRGPEETFSPADRRLLNDFARPAAVAAHAVILTSDVQRARTRVVTAREEERRRIRRDLHDGLGPQLASQTLALDAARALIASDPAAADELLVELREQTREAVSGIRRLVYDLRPPVLDDRGLAAALREQVPRFNREGLEVHTDIDPDLPPLPAALDVAAYRIALEALTNVVRHARATRCELRLAVDDGHLLVEVTDDGVGTPAETTSGVGLTSMRERAAELSGSVAIRVRPEGGTALQARLPIVVGD